MLSSRTNTLIIKTPEGIEFSLQLAGPITRFLAWAVDLGTIIAIISILNVIFGILGILSRDLQWRPILSVFSLFQLVTEL